MEFRETIQESRCSVVYESVGEHEMRSDWGSEIRGWSNIAGWLDREEAAKMLGL